MLQRILIVDPSETAQTALAEALAAEAAELLAARTPEQAFAQLASSEVDVILCDRDLHGIDDFDLVSQLARLQPDVAILLTAEGDRAALAADALRRGACGCLARPFSTGELLLALRSCRQRAELGRSNRLLRRELDRTGADTPIVAASPVMSELLERLERLADFAVPVVLLGEIGTGKEALARALHALSPRRAERFVPVRCSRVAPDALEAELFGHTRQAGVAALRPQRGLFCAADHGSIFLDEVAELAPATQAKLVQLLEEEAVRPLGESKPRAIDVRILAATSCDLDAEVAAGRFRADLQARLGGAVLRVPPLRERGRDLPLCVDSVLARCRLLLGKPVQSVSNEALQRLLIYRWPGNLRELGHVIERAVLLCRGHQIDIQDLPQEVVCADAGAEPEAATAFCLRTARRIFEARMIERALRATSGNRTRAARHLGISHRALLYKLKELGVRG